MLHLLAGGFIVAVTVLLLMALVEWLEKHIPYPANVIVVVALMILIMAVTFLSA